MELGPKGWNKCPLYTARIESFWLATSVCASVESKGGNHTYHTPTEFCRIGTSVCGIVFEVATNTS